MHSKLLTAHGLLEKPQTSFCPPGIFYGKNSRYFIASDAIGFGTDPIHFGAPACRFVSIPHRFGLGRIGMQPAARGFGSFRYHFKSKRYRFNPNRYRNDHKQLPLESINSRDTRFFDITLSPSDITLTQSDIVSSHPEISWSWQRFTPGLRTTNWAVIDRPYSSGINTVGAVYDRATSVRKSFETETGLSVVAEILYWFSRTSKVCRQPSIKLLEASLKSGFAVSRFPGFQIACSDEVFLPDLHYWNVIFLNDFAEMAWRIARLKGRTRNIDEAPARLALHCLWAHGILHAPNCASKVPSC